MNIEEILNKYELKVGSHKSLDQGACVMEMVSYIANEPWSDHPQCACPTLTSMAIRYNDKVDDDHRQKLKALIPLLVNSKNPELRKARINLFCLRAVTHMLPILTDALDLKDISAALRLFTVNDFLAAKDFIRASVPAIKIAAKKHADAAADAAADADAAAAAAAAAAAYADAAGKVFWTDIKLKTWSAWFDAIKEVCELKQ